jgi:AraC-like DNA-binding protein
MDYSLFITSTAAFIETRLKEPIEYAELEKTVGFTYRHIRETFKECTGVPLSRYILLRRLANSAFEIVHTAKSLTEIASDYAFESYDTFTRAYKRHCGCHPSDLKRSSCKVRVGRKRIAIGVIAPVIMNNDVNPELPAVIPEVMNSMENIQKTEQSCILYGVPKVAYSFEGCTPFCVALKACLNYMGQNIDYTYIMAITGAAFRLRWNTHCWDGGNVDIMNIYEDRYEAFKRIFRAAGRSYRILKRENSDKEGFKQFIKSEIDEGRPVIAFGIIGPSEACLITGYQNNGEKLLGRFGWFALL